MCLIIEICFYITLNLILWYLTNTLKWILKQEIFFKCIIIFTSVSLEKILWVRPYVHIYSFIIMKINLELGPNYLWREKQINYYFFNAIRENFFSNCHGPNLASSYLQHYFITNKLKIPSIIDPILNSKKLIKS